MNRNERLDNSELATRLAIQNALNNTWTALPAIVVSVDLARMVISAQPAIQGVITDANGNEQNVNLPVLTEVPIVFPSAGGMSLTLPITAGDEVLVVFADRCIDAWWQSGGIQQQAEARSHDLSDAFAIPGPRSVPNVVGGISATAAQLRSDDGTVFLEINPNGTATLTAPSGVTINGDTQINGNLFVDGEIEATGNITPNV